MVLTKKSIIDDLARKSAEISRKMEYCFPAGKEHVDNSFINLFTLLYYHELQHRPHEPQWEGRDRLIATQGAMIPNLFAVLAELEYFGWNRAPQMISTVMDRERALTLSVPGVYGIINTPVLAMTLANGLALREKSSQYDCKIYVVMDDDRELPFLETIFSTSGSRLDNIIVITKVGRDQSRAQALHNWFALGWHIEEVDFDSMDSLFSAFSGASRMRGKPTVLIA